MSMCIHPLRRSSSSTTLQHTHSVTAVMVSDMAPDAIAAVDYLACTCMYQG